MITTDLRLNEPRYASLPNIMKARSKPLETKPLESLDLDLKPHLKVLKVVEPPKRQGGIKVEVGRRTGRETQSRGGDLMAVLVIADHDGANLRDTTHKTVTAATDLSHDVDILVLGQGADAPAAAAAKIAGVRKVLLAESEPLKHLVAEAVQAVVVPLMAGYDAVLAPAGTDGKNFAPRIAAALDVAVISDIVQVLDAKTFVRPIYAGNALETVQTSDAKKVITVRPTAFKAHGRRRLGRAVEKIDATAPPANSAASSPRKW